MAKKPKARIANNIRELRFSSGEMTQAELAEKCGVSRQTIVAIEKMKYSPSLELAFRISEVFRVSIEGIFWEEALVKGEWVRSGWG